MTEMVAGKTGRRKAVIFALLVILVLPLAAVQATEVVQWRFTLDWAKQGPQAPFLVALERGYFAEEGLDIIMDRGFGSAHAIVKIAGGAYDLGYADINSMIEFNAKHPDQALIAIAMVLNHPPFSILTLRDRGIETVQDLEGRTLGAPVGDAPRRLFPLFACIVGIDYETVEWVSMAPPLREPALIMGEVDAITGFFFTGYLNLIAAGVAEEDIIYFIYADYGLDLYGNAVIVPPALLEENPEAVRGFLRALFRGWKFAILDPVGAIEILHGIEPLIDPEIELRRLQLAIEHNFLTPDLWVHGFGDIIPERLERAIDLIVEGFALPLRPEISEVFTSDFLPPLEERMPPIPAPEDGE